MSERAFDRLCEAYGLQLGYETGTGETVRSSPEARRAVLSAMSVSAATPEEVLRNLEAAPKRDAADDPVAVARSYMPNWLAEGRCWGVTCQLYGLRTKRNHGIGDFEDLARLAEQVAADGADFVGVNPLHALFSADPERCSPFSPSNRLFLNPLYIAIDAIPGLQEPPPVETEEAARLRDADWVDYTSVARLKLATLRACWDDLCEAPALWQEQARASFDRFVAEGGEALRLHVLFEALSAHLAADFGAGWRDWPEDYRSPRTDAVARFAQDHGHEVGYQFWLQWVADRQLARAAERARGAGMRIGLYLDVAVGTAPDGSATWSDPDLVVPGANVGAPPDAFFTGGQDWGLAPMSPRALHERDYQPLRDVLEAVSRHAGAIRIDHAMSLTRLFWIPEGFPATDGCYVHYPLASMLRTLSDVSNRYGTIIIGEDLGTVPKGFGRIMRDADLQSYRVLYFEWVRNAFRAASSYRRQAFVTVSTHDLPPFRGWWAGSDIDLFQELGLLGQGDADARREGRARDRAALIDRLRRDLPPRCARTLASADVDEIATAAHVFLARTPSRLFGVQVEDLCEAARPVNVPGTWKEYPNWRLRTASAVEEASARPAWRTVVDAVTRERAK
ncbi:4-alpha-glucanotransferase [Breoghania sp. JC706]|uniref:4-alpha-glucanotransferase n=1 Tax=Breoghania sp. JC706 TaxID=3117732 RepID=UPI0030085D8B